MSKSLESAREWIKGLLWYLGAGADTSLDAQFVAGEARGLERAAESLEALYRRYKRAGGMPMDFGRCESVDTIRALKPEGRS